MSDPQRTRSTIDEQLGEIGSAIRDRRVRSGLTQEALALQAQVSLGSVQNLERGRGSSLRTLLRVTRLLGAEEWLDALEPPRAPAVSPMQLLREQKSAAKRRRVRHRAPRPSSP